MDIEKKQKTFMLEFVCIGPKSMTREVGVAVKSPEGTLFKQKRRQAGSYEGGQL